MEQKYVPREYWERRLRSRFNLRGVGHHNFSAFYNRWLYRRKARCLQKALSDVPIKDQTVLDIGCGTGFFVDWYLRHGAVVSGIDITDVSVERLRERFVGDFRTVDISAPDFPLTARFDLVNMWDVMYHIVDPNAFDRALRNIAGCLKPGGLFLVTDWLGADTDHSVAEHVQARCLETYRHRFANLGVELVSVHPLYHLLNMRQLGVFDEVLAPLYFLLDDRATRISPSNLSMAVWRKRPTPE